MEKVKKTRRVELKEYKGKTVQCTGRFTEVRFKTARVPILLFRDVRIADVEYDHLWMSYNSEVAQLDLMPDMILEFSARVVECDEGTFIVDNFSDFVVKKNGNWAREHIPIKLNQIHYAWIYKNSLSKEELDEKTPFERYREECNIDTGDYFFTAKKSNSKTRGCFKKNLHKIAYNVYSMDGEVKKEIFNVAFIPPAKNLLINHKYYADIKEAAYRKMCIDYFISVRRFDDDYFVKFDKTENEENVFRFDDADYYPVDFGNKKIRRSNFSFDDYEE